MSRRGRQSQLSDSLERLVGRLDRRGGKGYTQARVAQAWKAIAGASVLAHTAGVHLRGDELVVMVDSPLWATELSALSEAYRTAMNRELDKERVRSIRFTVSMQFETTWKMENEPVASTPSTPDVEAIPLTPEELAQVELSVSEIEDEELRSAVLRATVADLQWKKGLRARKSPEKPRENP